ncbi:hypothetical protein PFISCL1PPCAC_7616, partial [Pristionchus fissidentatus]
FSDRGRKRANDSESSDDSDERKPGEDPREPLNIGHKRNRVMDEDFFDRAKEFIAFDSRFVRAMFNNLKVLMVGDSLMRGLYKDFLTWLKSDDLSKDVDLKAKAENSYMGDRQIDVTQLEADKIFRQAREYQTDHHHLQFFFSTRVMKDDMDALIQQMITVDGYPDVILINSMIWDLTRYFRVRNNVEYGSCAYQKEIEADCLQKYLDRTSMLLRRLRAVLPPHTMVVWVCFPHCRPSEQGGGGMQKMPLAEERNHVIRSVMIDGSFRIAQVVRAAGYDVLDIDFYMRNHAFYHYQKNDGMHWWPAGMRLMSQLVLQFLATSWGIDASDYLAKLERAQDPEIMAWAELQLKHHDFDWDRQELNAERRISSYSDGLPELRDGITEMTLEKMPIELKYHVEKTIQWGRALAPLMQEAVPAESKPLTQVADDEEVRLAPLIDTLDELKEAEDMSDRLAAVSKMVREREGSLSLFVVDEDERRDN